MVKAVSGPGKQLCRYGRRNPTLKLRLLRNHRAKPRLAHALENPGRIIRREHTGLMLAWPAAAGDVHASPAAAMASGSVKASS